MMWLKSVLIVLILTGISCSVNGDSKAGPEVNNVTNLLRLKIKVEKYIVNAMRDSFMDGVEKEFDATQCEVISAQIDIDKKLIIYHDAPPDESSFWRNIGGIYYITLEKKDLLEMDLLFSGAIISIKK